MNIRALVFALVISLFPLGASAHVVVKPAEAGVASFQTFTMGVPSEKPLATVGLRLLMPAGLDYVTPTVKPGWKITVKKDNAGTVTEIDWTGGRIPTGQRDDFTFSAKVPATETVIAWKAYQTYSDGSVVAWDNDPAGEAGATDFSAQGPYSMTKIVNDIGTAPGTVGPQASELASFVLAAVALVVAGLALSRTKKHPHTRHVA